MKRRTVLNTAGLAGISAFAATPAFAQMAAGDRFGAKISSPDMESGKEKHVPMIDAPASAKAGEKFTVTVQVGKVVPHPNTIEHHIQSIELYALEEGSQYLIKIAAVDLGPTFADPTITVPVMLKNSATLYAVEYCNIHGLWDNMKKITITA